MNISQAGIDLIKRFEGCVLKSYRDIVGIATIGYGCTHGVKLGMTITQEQAEQLLRVELTIFERGVTNLVTSDITQGMFDALVSFAYNLGLQSLKGSTLLKDLNAGKYSDAQDQFRRWINAGGVPVKGLVARRAAEAELFGS